MSALAHQSARKGDGDLTRLSAADLAAKLATREISSVEATQAHLDRIAAVDGDIHAFLHVSDRALDVAADIDRRRAAGESLGPVAGVPLAIKDVLVTTDMPSTSGSKILEGYMSPFDAKQYILFFFFFCCALRSVTYCSSASAGGRRSSRSPTTRRSATSAAGWRSSSRGPAALPSRSRPRTRTSRRRPASAPAPRSLT